MRVPNGVFLPMALLIPFLGLAISSMPVHVAATDSTHTELKIWPAAAPDEPGHVAELKAAAEKRAADPERIAFVDIPTLTLYPAPPDQATRCSVIVCPGGGYNILAWPKEGLEIAEWLNSLGVSAFVLKYRVPRRDPKTPHTWPLQDIQRAIRVVRANADQWRIDPARIGVLGFSAGGNLAVLAGTQWDKESYSPIDDVDKLSCRPDFMIPIYAAYLGADEESTQLHPMLRVTAETPPTFMAVTWDDKLRGLHAALLFAELKKANVPAEVHVFSKGGHGYGMRPSDNSVSGWPDLCAAWMRSSGLLEQ